MSLTYAFRLAPSPQAFDQAKRADPKGSRPFDTRYF